MIKSVIDVAFVFIEIMDKRFILRIEKIISLKRYIPYIGIEYCLNDR